MQTSREECRGDAFCCSAALPLADCIGRSSDAADDSQYPDYISLAPEGHAEAGSHAGQVSYVSRIDIRDMNRAA
jgi:hypothetical protein